MANKSAILRVGEFPVDCNTLGGWYFAYTPGVAPVMHGWQLHELRALWLWLHRN